MFFSLEFELKLNLIEGRNTANRSVLTILSDRQLKLVKMPN